MTDRIHVIVHRHEDRWWWTLMGKSRLIAGPWVRIESAVANLEEVLGVTTEWVKPKPGQRQLVVTGRPVDVEIRR